MDAAERFRKNADDCRERAQRALTEADRAKWLAIAADWVNLADWMVGSNGFMPKQPAE
jgi:hypothetical protein